MGVPGRGASRSAIVCGRGIAARSRARSASIREIQRPPSAAAAKNDDTANQPRGQAKLPFRAQAGPRIRALTNAVCTANATRKRVIGVSSQGTGRKVTKLWRSIKSNSWATS